MLKEIPLGEPVTSGRWMTEQLTDDMALSIRSENLLYRNKSSYQMIEIHETETFGKMLRLDGAFTVSERDEFFYHENLVHVPACSHTLPYNALIIGGGDGGSAEELLKHRCLQSVTQIEIDAKVVDAARRYLGGIHHGVMDDPSSDPRFTLRIGDPFAFVRNDKQFYDLIILDLTAPGGPLTPLYSSEFYRLCSERLTFGGLLSLHIASPFVRPERMRNTLRQLSRSFSIVRPYMVTAPVSGGIWMMACASQITDCAAIGRNSIDARLSSRRVKNLQYYNAATHHCAMGLPNFIGAQLGITQGQSRWGGR